MTVHITYSGDFGVSNNAKILLYAPDFSLLPGSNFGIGELDAIPSTGYSCGQYYREANNSGGTKKPSNSTGTELENTLTTATNLVSANTARSKVYPNPSSGNLTIKKESEEESTIIVSDVTGNIIQQSKITGTTNSLDISSLQNGVYMLQVGVERFKIILAK
ncbi:MAG: T9SS type A sorting domain-containing protein [Bacteroidetes bacterium]|nr:T9SS type A sorting domain-containing protein [Bacteroidota bacterium]